MNWIKENKFLTGYFAVVLIATGVLGYFVLAAKGKYDQTVETYHTQAAELHRLKTLPLFPNSENLKKLEDEKAQQLAKVEDLQASLAEAKLPVEAMTPAQFQDKLRASVTDFEKKAGDVGMALPKDFYMGFKRYESIPPKPAAAPLLGRELKAIEMVLDVLPAHSIVELKSIKRDDLPEEEIGGKAETPKTLGSLQPAMKGPQGRTEAARLIARHSFELTFLAPKGSSQFVLNDIVTNKFQCLVPRLIVLKNEKDKGPSRGTNATTGLPPQGPAGNSFPAVPAPAAPVPSAGAATPAATPAAPAPEQSETHEYIVGDEKVETTLLIEIVDVADVPAKPVASK